MVAVFVFKLRLCVCVCVCELGFCLAVFMIYPQTTGELLFCFKPDSGPVLSMCEEEDEEEDEDNEPPVTARLRANHRSDALL